MLHKSFITVTMNWKTCDPSPGPCDLELQKKKPWQPLFYIRSTWRASRDGWHCVTRW